MQQKIHEQRDQLKTEERRGHEKEEAVDRDELIEMKQHMIG